MKDIVFTSKRIKKEAYILLGCFAFAFILNILSIFIYKTQWFEIFTQIGYVVIITIILYFLITLGRLVIIPILKLLKPNQNYK
jgi:uncharacterized membrane protein